MQQSQIKELLKSFCLSGKRIHISPLDVDWLIKTGLGSIACDYAVLYVDDKASIEKLNANKLSSKFWFQSQLSSAKEVITKLNSIEVVPILLKGMAISTSLYPHSFYRVMRDIDLLVEDNVLEKTELVLPEMGYEQKSDYSKEFYKSLHHTMPWQHKKNKTWLEIHKNLFPKTSACNKSVVFQMDVINSEKERAIFSGLEIFQLSKEFQIVYIATHWAEKFKNIGGAFGLLDIALLINYYNNDIKWEKIITWANSKFIANYVYLIVQYLKKNNFLDSSVNIDNHLESINHSQNSISIWILDKIIDVYIIDGKPFGRILSINNITILWRHLLEPGNTIKKVVLIPIAIMFPRGSKKRFNLRFQYSRVMSLLVGRKE